MPFEKESHSLAEMTYATEQRNTTLGKSDGVSDEVKLCADNIIHSNTLNRPSPSKEYRYNEFERLGRLSRNRVRDTKEYVTFYFFFIKVFVCKIMILTLIILYTFLWSL